MLYGNMERGRGKKKKNQKIESCNIYLHTIKKQDFLFKRMLCTTCTKSHHDNRLVRFLTLFEVTTLASFDSTPREMKMW